jgi:hypothetical protein
MAVMIPDSCPSRATAGEKRVFSLLRDALPDHFTAWYEPVVAGRLPDFTVLADDFGLLVLEVKGWYAGQVARADDHRIELHRNEGDEVRVETTKHPRMQARAYVLALLDELARPEHAILQQPDGEHRGKTCFPCGYGVVLTNITRAQLDEAKLSPLFAPEWTLCRDELAGLGSAGDREVIRRLRGMFPAPFPFDPLTEDQVKTLRGVLHREVVVRTRPATPASVPDGQLLLPGMTVLDVLDAKQEQVARSLGSGHHVVFGIAGSGKTVLLLARARLIASRDPSKRVLILCYNKALAASLAAQLGDGPELRDVEVRHFDSWIATKTKLRKRPEEPWDEFQARMVGAMLRDPSLWPESERYDAILIDEGHDFEPDWFRCATGLLRGGEEGDLLIALDGAQSLYKRERGFTWDSVGVQAKGRSRRLDRNYRNTKQILEFAWQVAQSVLPDDPDDGGTRIRVLPRKATRQGPVPRFQGCSSADMERVLITRLVEELKARGVPDSEIAVLYPRADRGRAGGPGLVDSICDALGRVGPVCRIRGDQDAKALRRSLEGPGVRVMTIHAAKGLEFRAVILAALDLLPNPIERDEARDSRLFYVGLTRAIDELYVTWSGASAFTDRVRRSSKATPLSDPARE